MSQLLNLLDKNRHICKKAQNLRVDRKLNKRLLFLSLWLKVNINFTLEQATKTQRGSRGIAILFL